MVQFMGASDAHATPVSAGKARHAVRRSHPVCIAGFGFLLVGVGASPTTMCNDIQYRGRQFCDSRPDCIWCVRRNNPTLFECAPISEAHKMDPKLMSCDWDPSPPPGPGPPGPAPSGQCDVPGTYPSGHTEALQEQRPPQQTSSQATLVETVTRGAEGRSDAAKAALQQLVQTALDEIAHDTSIPEEIRRMGAGEMMDVLQWEFARLPLIHNAPLEDAAQINDDTKMTTTLTNGYLQNVAQRYLLGVESKKNLINEGAVRMAAAPWTWIHVGSWA